MVVDVINMDVVMIPGIINMVVDMAVIEVMIRSYTKTNLAWYETENSEFSMKSLRGKKISYKRYLKKVYNLGGQQLEFCVAKQDLDQDALLPQHMKLTLRSDEVTDYTEIL